MGGHDAVSWGEFTAREPDLAAFGLERLMAAPSYLATVQKTGVPRVHPVTPIFTDSGLFVYMEPTSPKGRDLRERGWFAMHNGVLDNAGSGGEFFVSGLGRFVEDERTWAVVAESSSYVPADHYVLFELLVLEARCNGYGDVELPATRRWPGR